ncbi:DNA polymerase III PolC-type [Thalassovita gelatinovora]|uniref:DNA-directed DNA polymerase n=1 Tax=Thalassovita gelatinovora TaxID=53501 RepID=A0A0N7LU41_THAGE|nr:3'-5' exonuclease [Thalassovita gelatinovora]QIZ79253.1 3'-5' exonuclease [Thalassovita gelatinovora]CUH62442.1 DNA polymerase III PolC-type [Thalassovita gelatinovora]SEQ04382.1 DNA polymerase-3 subunit epsilon [Thalassovita gelatinovora]
MFLHLGLRLRIFLFFALVALGGIAAIFAGLYVGYLKALSGDLLSAFVQAGTIAAFGILGLAAGVWLLFDEHVAKPIERLSARLRVGAHAGVSGGIDDGAARYLGDLGPAAEAVTRQLSENALDSAGEIALKTEQLRQEMNRLTALLSDIPVAMVLINARHQIVLYDSQSAAVLGQVHTPRLNASIFDYFKRAAIETAWAKLIKTGQEVAFTANGAEGEQDFELRMKPLDQGSGYMLIIDEAHATIEPEAARPLIYDFDLLQLAEGSSADETRLSDLTFVVFDSETTGLLPHKDEIVQLGALRVVRGKIVQGEALDMLVNPMMPIPPGSTRVHGITDAMVVDAAPIDRAVNAFHKFAHDAVIVAHNAPFDMAFMHRHGNRLGLSWDHPVLDTVLASAVLFGASESHTLDALCDRLGVEIPVSQRHSAMGDARATALVLCRMLPMLEARGIATFGNLLAEMRKHGRMLKDLN